MKGPWNIPKIWKWVEIKSLGDIVSGGTPSTKEMSYWGDDINWISPADLTGYTSKTIARGAKNLTHQGLDRSSAKLMPAGSIHFSSRAPIGYVAISSQPLSTNQGFKSLVPTQGVFNEYVYYYLKAAKYIAEEMASGTTFREISGTAFGRLPLPFSALPEQHQIVAKIEELFSELDNGIENLKRAREQLKTYRQAVLKYAFEGKLTEQWRTRQMEAGNPPEPAEKLLEQIKSEREKYYQKQVVDWVKASEQARAASKKKPTKPKKPKELSQLTEKELEELPELPEGWEWERLMNISNSFGGYAFKSKHFSDSGKYQVIKIANVKMGYMPLNSNPAFLEHAEKDIIHKYSLKKGDCIISLTGTRKKRDYGFIAMVKDEKNLLLNQRLGAMRFYKPLLPEFFQYSLRGEHFQNNFFRHETGNVGQGNVGMKAITEETIALPSIEEQNIIVQEIESRLSVCDQIERTIEDSLKKSEALRQSILKKAFSGELTKDWRGKHPELVSGENSVEKLMEKIKAEKTLITGLKQPRTGKTKRKVKQ